MFGVILWSNSTDRKAVIWCEDQGDLAYYEENQQNSEAHSAFFDAGDYVEFDVTVDENLRRACNAINVATLDGAVQTRTSCDFVSGVSKDDFGAISTASSATVVNLSEHRRVYAPVDERLSHLG